MKVENNQIRLKTSEWNFKVKNKGRRMKIYIKLNQEEGQRWTDIKNAVTGGGKPVPDEEFAKIILFRGLNAFMDDMHEAMNAMDEEEKKKILEEAGVEENVEIDIPEIPQLGPTSKLTTDENN